MNYQGDLSLGDTLDFKFTTVDSTGVPTTLAGSPVVAAYVGNSTTEITAGVTLTVDFDSRTGLHNVRVVASSGNGFAAATNVNLVITAGTVGGNSVVGYVVGSFSIQARAVDGNAIADAILRRDWTAVSGEASYSLLQAARMLRDKWDTASGTLTVYKEDGITVAWTRTLTTNPAADPITGAS